MKLLRYGPAGQEKPGLLDNAGRIRALSPALADIGPAQISQEAMTLSRKFKSRAGSNSMSHWRPRT